MFCVCVDKGKTSGVPQIHPPLIITVIIIFITIIIIINIIFEIKPLVSLELTKQSRLANHQTPGYFYFLVWNYKHVSLYLTGIFFKAAYFMSMSVLSVCLYVQGSWKPG